MQPKTILIPARSDNNILNAIESSIPFCPKSNIDLRPSSEFQAAAGRAQLLSVKLNVPNIELYLNSLLNLDTNPQSVGAAGCLLTYLVKSQDGGNERSVDSVRHFALRDFMHLTGDTFRALGIFEDEHHPNRHSTKTKEGLSLFGILNKTRTPMGRFLLRQWFLRPLLDRVKIRERQFVVGLLAHPRFKYVTTNISACLRKIKNIPKIINIVRTSSTVSHWQNLQNV